MNILKKNKIVNTNEESNVNESDISKLYDIVKDHKEHIERLEKRVKQLEN